MRHRLDVKVLPYSRPEHLHPIIGAKFDGASWAIDIIRISKEKRGWQYWSIPLQRAALMFMQTDSGFGCLFMVSNKCERSMAASTVQRLSAEI